MDNGNNKLVYNQHILEILKYSQEVLVKYSTRYSTLWVLAFRMFFFK